MTKKSLFLILYSLFTRFTRFSRKNAQRGFTLIELVVVLVVLGTLISLVVTTLNPLRQISKSRDTKRTLDLEQIGDALDLYYHDHNCYPTAGSLIPIFLTGAQWSEGRSIYTKKMPIDPDRYIYKYVTRPDDQNCPQWAAVFSKLTLTPASGSACPLSLITSEACTPIGDYGPRWACIIRGDPKAMQSSGTTGCQDISSTPISQTHSQ